jgi:hypothetical protein
MPERHSRPPVSRGRVRNKGVSANPSILAPDASSHALALKKRPFVIRSLLWTPASPATVTSSLLSQTLDKTVLASSLNADAAQLTLTTLRKLIQRM